MTFWQAFWQALSAIWNSLKSNPVFVAGYSAFIGAIVSAIQDEVTAGKMDWSRGGVEKLLGYAATTAIVAVAHLYQAPPKSVPVPATPPAPAPAPAPAPPPQDKP